MLRGLLDALAVSVSLGLQRTVPVSAYVVQLALARFKPAGWTDSQLGYAHSVVDYVARWLGLRFPDMGPLTRRGRRGKFKGVVARYIGVPGGRAPELALCLLLSLCVGGTERPRAVRAFLHKLGLTFRHWIAVKISSSLPIYTTPSTACCAGHLADSTRRSNLAENSLY